MPLRGRGLISLSGENGKSFLEGFLYRESDEE